MLCSIRHRTQTGAISAAPSERVAERLTGIDSSFFLCQLLITHEQDMCRKAGEALCFCSCTLWHRRSGLVEVLHRHSNAAKHQPSGLLGYTQKLLQVIGTHSTTLVGNHPKDSKPVTDQDRRVFQQRIAAR